MRKRQNLKGLTLIEILLSLVIISSLLMYLIPQQLKNTHEQLVEKTVAQMNLLALSARNYYQDQQALYPTSSNASHWPQTLKALTDANYLPASALCSSWPLQADALNDPASNKNADCLHHQEYAIFPANSSGQYDMTLNGIKTQTWTGFSKFYSSGGNFWGVSLTLPTTKMALEVRERLPFATLCAPTNLSAQLSNNTACTKSNTVTILVPRPAKWTNNTQYAKDGLIQSIGTASVCGSDGKKTPCNSSPPPFAYIPKPTSCGVDPSGNLLTPVLFVYPFDYQLCLDKSYDPTYCTYHTNFKGISLIVQQDPDLTKPPAWDVYAGMFDHDGHMQISYFWSLAVAYFTVCEPSGNNTWDILTPPKKYSGG